MYRVLPSAYPTIPGQSEGGYDDPNQPQQPGLDYYNVDEMKYDPTGSPNPGPYIEGSGSNTRFAYINYDTSSKAVLSGVVAQNASKVTAVRISWAFTHIIKADGTDIVGDLIENNFTKVFSDPDPSTWTIGGNSASGDYAYALKPRTSSTKEYVETTSYTLKLEAYDANGNLLQSASVDKSYVVEV